MFVRRWLALEADLRRKLRLGGALGLILTGCLCLLSLRLGGLALIILALGAVAAFASRLL